MILDDHGAPKTRHTKKNATYSSSTTRSATAYDKNLTKTNFSSETTSQSQSHSHYKLYKYIFLTLRSFSAIFHFKCKGKRVTRFLQQYFKLLRNSATVFCGELRQNSKGMSCCGVIINHLDICDVSLSSFIYLVFFLYFIPAGLYCLYNNLAYTNLLNFDPTTYFLFLQFRVVVTGVVFQVYWRRPYFL